MAQPARITQRMAAMNFIMLPVIAADPRTGLPEGELASETVRKAAVREGFEPPGAVYCAQYFVKYAAAKT